jgi:tight adherence protein B
MKIALIMAILSVPLIGGIVATQIWARKKERGAIASRLSRLMESPIKSEPPLTLLKRPTHLASLESFREHLEHLPGMDALRLLLWQAGHEDRLPTVLILEGLAVVLPLLLAFAFGLNILFGMVLSLILAATPIIVLKSMVDARRSKFCELLPNAIDLMVAVLRSGHSIPQAVKAVAAESPQPCGDEFENVLHRLNLGQPLSESLIISAKRFQSYELDLMRKAVAIQNEVGGSLAELLDKTNATLRERLKQAKQLKVITAQSRLSAGIVGLLPIILAIGLNILSPGYMQMLVDDPIGRLLLCVSILLEVLGVYVMRQMSTMKV